MSGRVRSILYIGIVTGWIVLVAINIALAIAVSFSGAI